MIASNSPLVSVVIPSYNGAQWIAETIRSVQQQEYGPLEIIVVLDGSTDHTEDVLRQFGAGVQVILQQNAGPAVGRNRGIRAARGKYVALLDDDDLWEPKKIARQVALMEQDATIGLVFCNYRPFGLESPGYADGFSRGPVLRNLPGTHIAENTIRLGGLELFDGLLKDLFSWTSTLLVRRDLLDQVGMYDENLRYAGEDWQLCLKLALVTNFACIDEVLAFRRERVASLSKQGHDSCQAILALQGLRGYLCNAQEYRKKTYARLALAHFGLGFVPARKRLFFASLHFVYAAWYALCAWREPRMRTIALKSLIHSVQYFGR